MRGFRRPRLANPRDTRIDTLQLRYLVRKKFFQCHITYGHKTEVEVDSDDDNNEDVDVNSDEDGEAVLNAIILAQQFWALLPNKEVSATMRV
jgi:hypothetical protein